MERAAVRKLAWGVTFGLGAFLTLMTAAMVAYPGGTWDDKSHVGYSFWQNYWCDLLRDPALDGQSNAFGSNLAGGAMLALAATLTPFWFLASTCFAHRTVLTRCTRAMGSLGAMGLAFVTLLPSDKFGTLHAAAVVLAGPLGITAAILSVVGLKGVARVSRTAVHLGNALLIVATICLFLYMWQVWTETVSSVLVTTLQKIATVLLIAWMGTVTRQALALPAIAQLPANS